MDDDTVEHLKLIQNVIDHMGRNSFHLKAAAVILVAAIFAVAETQADSEFLLIGLVPVVTFWGLDAYYLWQEKYFRALYDGIRKGTHDIEKYGLFSMDTNPYDNVVEWWPRVLLNRTVAGFYLPLGIIVGLIGLLAGD